MQVEEKLRETEEAYVDLCEEFDRLQAAYDDLHDQHRWVHAVASILVEMDGGIVSISNELLSNYDLRGQIRMTFDPDTDTWAIEVIPFEEAE